MRLLFFFATLLLVFSNAGFCAQEKLKPAPKGVSQLLERDGVLIGNLRYVMSEKKRDLLLEKALRLNGWSSGDSEDAAVSYSYSKVDLNGDGIPEALVYIYGPLACGSGGCHARIATLRNGKYKIIGDSSLMHAPIIVTNRRSRGWKNLIFCSRYGYFRVSWNGTYYANGFLPLAAGDVVSGTAAIADSKPVGFKLRAARH